MRRICLLLCFAFVFVFVSGSAVASAAKPERMPPPDELLDGTFDAGSVCAFQLRYQELVNNETTTTISDTQTRVNGAYRVRLTNLDTGRSLDVNASGPQFFTADGGITAVLPGRQIFLLFPGDAGGPGAFLATGRSTLTRDLTAATITKLHLGGSVTDLCASLA